MAEMSLGTGAGEAGRLLPGMVVGERRAAQDLQRWYRFGYFALLATVGVGVLWSSLAPLSSAVVAQGVVKVDSSRKKIQHAEGGSVKEILVREGDQVKAGQVLVRLDETKAGAAHGVVTGGRDVAQATEARLVAERDDKPTINFPADLLKRAETLPHVKEIMSAQTAQFGARRTARNGELSIIEQQIGSLRNEIEGFQSQRRSKDEQMESLNSDLRGLVELDKQGMVERTRLRQVERDIARLKGERDELTSKMASTQTAISEQELKKFQVRRSFQEDVAAEFKKVQAENFELIERESATQRSLDLMELRAPVAGTVTDMKVHTAGGVVGPGEVLMELVPSDDRLIVEGKVLPADVDRLQLGQKAGVKLHAFNRRTSPELNAELVYISADAMVDPRNDQSYFVVKLVVPPAELVRLGEQQKVQPGMQSDIFIRTGERTFMGYLMEPLVDSFDKAWRER